MPELPEVETTRRGVAPFLVGETVSDVVIRDSRLRWPVTKEIKKNLLGQTIRKIDRRAKYLLFYTDTGCMLLHLGMSGSLRILDQHTPADKHDHFDLVLASDRCLRFRDPRRFGSIHWTGSNPDEHKLLNKLGPEPLSDTLTGDYLYLKSRNRSQAVKNFIMDSHIVVGVGNIYASEALFAAGINPSRRSGGISKSRYGLLSENIKSVLTRAIRKGGTTLRDFVNGAGQPGYFKAELQVYDRAGKPCMRCKKPIKSKKIGQRSTYYCSNCQK